MAARNIIAFATVDLSNIAMSKNNANYKWGDSIGAFIPFCYDYYGIKGVFELIDFKKPENLHNKHLYLKYNGELLKPIIPSYLKNGRLSGILDEYCIKWEYAVGETINRDGLSLTVINRFRKRTSDGYLHKFYNCMCNICGYDGGSHYIRGEHRDKWVVSEYDLKHLKKCSCCCSRIVVDGINDISKKATWMINYLNNPDDSHKYTPTSSMKIDVKCPFCGTIIKDKISPAQIFSNNGISCRCNDNISYPNKFGYYLFNELSEQIRYYEWEYCPDWAGRYKYDNYMVLKTGEKIIVEMDGLLGHGKRDYCGGHDEKGKVRDEIKDNMAKDRGILVIRINCEKSNSLYIKNKILKSSLSFYFDFSDVDWNKVDLMAKTRNKYKDICEEYNGSNYSVLCRKYDIGKNTLERILLIGNKHSWCNYTPSEKKNKKYFNDLYEKQKSEIYLCYSNDPSLSGFAIGKKLNISANKVIKILKELSDEGLISYDANKKMRNNKKIKCQNKPVSVYDLNNNILKKYHSVKECELNSVRDFGQMFYTSCIIPVCKNKKHDYKGYVFKYA